MGKMCFHSPPRTSEQKIINSSTRDASLSNDITHQNTRFHWSLLKSPGNLTSYYVALHFSHNDRDFSACCNTSRGIKLATLQASRLRSACLLAITLKFCCLLPIADVLLAELQWQINKRATLKNMTRGINT